MRGCRPRHVGVNDHWGSGGTHVAFYRNLVTIKNNLGGVALMPYFFSFLWDDETESHLADHGVTKEEFEYVVTNASSRSVVESDSSGRPSAFGYTESRRYLYCVWEEFDGCCLPITAYDVE